LPTLLVTGGSQGARRINQSVSAAADDFAAAGVQVLHVKGPLGEVTVPVRVAGEPPYVVVGYVDQMELAYAAADAVVGRSGANSVTEAASLGLPAVFVPLPIGNGEQALNARAVVDAGGAILVADEDFTPDWVRKTLPALLTDPDRLAQMGKAATGSIRRDADDALADLILGVIGAGTS
jgi:UDP-N-acetylglucosamine--N-acetylmuramyl-(pentapeptide) pyrophosphoryl-undecaprenol N-acetylglucosamine transferase